MWVLLTKCTPGLNPFPRFCVLKIDDGLTWTFCPTVLLTIVFYKITTRLSASSGFGQREKLRVHICNRKGRQPISVIAKKKNN